MSANEVKDDICQCPKCGRLHRHLGTPPISVMEQIARDMKEGTFPKKSEQTLREEAPSDPAQEPEAVALDIADEFISVCEAAALEAKDAEIARLQCALSFWMPGVDLRLDDATRELAASDAELLSGYSGPIDPACWGDGILERAITAESRISDLERQLAEETERNQWKPIETAPRDGTQFLAALSNGWTAILNEVRGWDRYAWYQGGGTNIPVARTHKADSLTGSILATHWRPLPSPPTAAAILGGAK
jgi:hypothetical protein